MIKIIAVLIGFVVLYVCRVLNSPLVQILSLTRLVHMVMAQVGNV
jgi:hypothetical protein